ncbi:MAG: PepSY domain-containing protein [Nitrosomonas sp.]
MKIRSLFAGSILLLSVSSLSWAGIFDKDVELTSLPPKVQEAINQHAQGGKIDSIEQEKSDGKLVYEVEVKQADGKEFEFKVDENGTLISMDKD